MSAMILFVSGADTEVGKTHIGVTIARELSRRGLCVRTVKPVESGVDGNHTEDGVRLSKATNQPWPKEALQRFKAPVAPPLAAEMEAKKIDTQKWRKTIDALATEADILMIEGAGGLLSPLDWNSTLVDFSKHWMASFILVDADKLGAVGRSRLCLSVLKTQDIPVLGLVLSAPVLADGTTGQNAESLSKVEPDTLVATAPRSNDQQTLIASLSALINRIEERRSQGNQES